MQERPPSKIKTILLSGFVAGTLDLLTAILVHSIILKQVTAIRLLQSIASGIFKNKAYDGGIEMALYGVLFHYCITFSFAIFFFYIFRHIPFLKKQTTLSGILYGLFVWAVMNLIVLRLVFTRLSPLTLESFMISAGILIFMIGIPISWITYRYYSSKNIIA
ncbi:MAG: DUF1440 domain-containing protein [Bacteroidota bacterium]